MLKAHEVSPAESHTVSEAPIVGLGGCIEDALVRAYGSKKASAIELERDRSQLRRQCELGTLMIRDIDRPEVLAQLGAVLSERFGHQRKSKKQIARERLPELIELMLTGLED